MDPDPESDRKAILLPSQAIVKRIQSHLPEGRILEVGPGWGLLGELLVDAGYSYHCLEPSRDMAGYCKNIGLSVTEGDLSGLRGRVFDAIVMRGVFEHLIDYEGWLNQAYDLLENGGTFFSSQPTASFAGLFGNLLRLGRSKKELPNLHKIFCPPWHNVLFSVEGMVALLGRSGFQRVEVVPSTQGREGGITGAMQLALEIANKVGWQMIGLKWPLILGHVFVFRKVARSR